MTIYVMVAVLYRGVERTVSGKSESPAAGGTPRRSNWQVGDSDAVTARVDWLPVRAAAIGSSLSERLNMM